MILNIHGVIINFRLFFFFLVGDRHKVFFFFFLNKNIPPKRKSIKNTRSELKLLSRVQLFATPWTVDYQAPQSMEFSRREYWSGLPLTSPGDLPNPGIEPGSPALQADAVPSEPPGKIKNTRGGTFIDIMFQPMMPCG